MIYLFFLIKKYIRHILPLKINELNKTTKYTGVVTGVVKFGIFVEFDEIYTGLIHTSEMSDEHINKFNNKKIINFNIFVCYS